MLSASIEKARAKLDEKVFQMMWDEGSAMSYGEAIRYATKLLIA